MPVGWKKNIFIVIPAYNEEKKISFVIKDLKDHGYSNIVVVDDCSADNTYAAAKKENVSVLRHKVNRGQGASLKTGIDFALLNNAKIIVTFDADGQHCAEDIPDIVSPIIKKEADAALGSRFLGKRSNVPLLKKIFLKGGVLFTWFLSGLLLTDTHNGFRGFSRKAAKLIDIKQEKMEHASEIIDEIRKKRIKFKEVPVTIRYNRYSRQKGQSVLNSFNIAFRMIIRKIMT